MKFGSRILAVLLLLGWAVGLSAEEDKMLAQVYPSAQKVTLQFQGMDIVEVLKILAEQAGFDLVAGKNVGGRATLFLKDCDPRGAPGGGSGRQ